MSVEDSITWGTPRARWVLLATVLGSGIAFLDATVVNVALPTIGTELVASVAVLQWVINGYTLTLASLILIGGSLGDRFGRRQDFPGRNRLVRGCVAALQRRADFRGTGRRPLVPGHRGRVAHARQPRHPSGFVRTRRSRAGGWRMVGSVWNRRGDRAVCRGVAHRRRLVASDLPDQRAAGGCGGCRGAPARSRDARSLRRARHRRRRRGADVRRVWPG